MHFPLGFRSSALRIFLALFGVGLTWTIYTNHTWEDYYITYRASKNLATGNGLTFTAGERVHSFTSPLGVLLPAVANLLTAHRSDYLALWIFRLTSIAAYAGAGLLLWRFAVALKLGRFASGLLIILFAIDTKILDFSTNGMETGFLLLFLNWTLLALVTSPPRHYVYLGCAWAGLMWTRPDSFIYIFVLSVGALIFFVPTGARTSRWHLIKTLFTAGLVTTALYLPWFIWSWSYYGSPIPHTVIAKGLFHSPTTLTSLAASVASFPASIYTHRDILAATFTPPYSFATGWPSPLINASYWFSAACLIVWLIPGVNRFIKLASLAFLCGEFYLMNYVGFPVPWYIPTVTVFSLIVLAGVIGQLLGHNQEATHGPPTSQSRRLAIGRQMVMGASLILVAGSITTTLFAAHQLRHQQTIIEHGNRREIGRWLRANATRGDTVFLEPLGYIGFYSNLKMLDYPGLSSPEIIGARKRARSRDYPDCWPELIVDLWPTWLVLRDFEAAAIHDQAPELLSSFYSLTKTFDVRNQVNAIEKIQGRGYLLNDALFNVYRLNPRPTNDPAPVASRQLIRTSSLTGNEAFGGPAADVGLKISAHAPSRLQLTRDVRARWLRGAFGIERGANEKSESSTDGASFQIFFKPDGGERQLLFRRDLNPRDQVADRGPQLFSVDLPGEMSGVIELHTAGGPNSNNSFDWAYWSFLRVETPGTN